jgi:hypothetical protein
VRRKIIEAEKAAPEIAREAIEMVRALYAVEKQASIPNQPGCKVRPLGPTRSLPSSNGASHQWTMSSSSGEHLYKRARQQQPGTFAGRPEAERKNLGRQR